MRIVLIDDNAAIRKFLKSFLSKHFTEAKIYSSENGIEGLGLVYAVEPDLVIIDTTIPKYSGKEVIEFLVSNPKFSSARTHVIALHESKESIEIAAPVNFTFLNKSGDDFLTRLIEDIVFFTKNHNFLATKLKSVKVGGFLKNSIKIANKSDVLFANLSKANLFLKAFLLLEWFFYQVLLSVVVSIFTVSFKTPKDSNIAQHKIDSRRLRVRTYPTIATILATLLITFFQVSLFVSGGMVILNTRVESIFALAENKTYEFNSSFVTDYLYDGTQVEFLDNGVMIKAESTTSTPVSFPTTNLEVKSYKFTPSIITNYSIEFDKIERIIEESESADGLGLNNEESSTMAYGVYSSSQDVEIRYQLSLDKTNWLYFDSNDEWRATSLGVESSNTIQQINSGLEKFNKQYSGSNLYIKVFLVSKNTANSPLLKKIWVETNKHVISSVDEPEDTVSINDIEKAKTINSVDFYVRIYNASFFNGEKVVKGKILTKLNNESRHNLIPEEELLNYEVEVSYENGELIGTTELYLNQKGEVEFVLREVNREGGFVVAKVLQKDTKVEVLPSSEAVENSTFIVDSTGDGVDASIDGLCADAGGDCTFRAAVMEANAASGVDDIDFNIPLSDPSWNTTHVNAFTISPTTFINVTDPANIDGSTQTVFTGDTNLEQTSVIDSTLTTGPEIIFNFSSSAFRWISFSYNSPASDVTLNDIGFYNGGFGGGVLNVSATGSTFSIDTIDIVDQTDSPFQLNSSVFDNFYFINSVIHPYSEDFEINSTNNFVFNNNISFQSEGIALINSLNAVVTNNTFENTTRAVLVNESSVTISDNVINNTSDSGIFVASAGASSGVTISNNIISNINAGALPIEVRTPDGVNVNDTDDTDTGTNDLMNWPVLTNITYMGSDQYRISGYLDGNPAEAPFEIEICESDNHVSGHGGCTQTVDTFTMAQDGAFTRTFTLTGASGAETFSALATNANGSTSEFGTYADAVPIFDGSEYIITVNSTSDEDNVSSSFYNCEGITALCGGFSGPGGVANGKTSLREAMAVANNHPGADKIIFEIPTTDANWDTVEFPDAFRVVSTIGPGAFNQPTIVDGTTQTAFTGDTRNGVEVIIDWAGVFDGGFYVYSDFEVKGIGFYNNLASIRAITIFSGPTSVTITDNEFYRNYGGSLRFSSTAGINYNISGNEFREVGLHPLTLVPNPSGRPISAFSGAPNGLIENNTFIDSANDIMTISSNTLAGNLLTLRGNTIDGFSSSFSSCAFLIYSNDSANTLSSTILEENEIHNSTDDCAIYLGGSAKATFKNNQIYDLGNVIPVNINAGTQDGNGTTENDADDTDTGINDLMNWPLLTNITYMGADQYQISGYLDGNPAEAPFEIEICESDNNPTGHGGCMQTVDTFSMAQDGAFTRTFTLTGASGAEKFSALATNANGSTSEFGTYADAVPIFDGSEYIITVNSTSDEDNVSSSFYNCEGITALCGGFSGVNGVADGKTSLREAIHVANNFAQPVTIEFNIPTSDDGYINPDGSRDSTLEPAGTYPVTPKGYFTGLIDQTIIVTTANYLKIDGYSQQNALLDTSNFGETLNGALMIQYIFGTNGFILVNPGAYTEISGLNLIKNSGNYLVFIEENSSIWIWGNYFGSDINGQNSNGFDHIAVWRNAINVIVGTNGDGVNDVSEGNLFMGNYQIYRVEITEEVDNIIISGNYFGVDKTTRNCSSIDLPNTRRSSIFAWGDSVQIGSDLDGVSDNEESNIIACVFAATPRAQVNLSTTPTGSALVARNYLGTNTYGDILTGNNVFGLRANFLTNNSVDVRENIIVNNDLGGVLVKANNIYIESNDINNLGLYDISVYEDSTLSTLGDIVNNSTGNIFVGDTTSKLTIRDNTFYNRNTNTMLDLIGGSEDAYGVTANDSLDSDTGPNDLQNYPTINTVTYLGAGQYLVSGDLDGAVGENPFDIEICESYDHPSNHGGCLQTLAHVTANSPWSTTVTILGSNGSDNRYLSTLATNTNGSTSEFSENFYLDTTNPDYTVADYNISLITPANNSTITDKTPAFDWSESSFNSITNPEVTKYRIYLDNILLAETTASNYIPTVELSLGAHTWNVKAYNASNTEVDTSATYTFTIEEITNTDEYTITPISPLTDTQLDDTTPIFDWEDTNYTLSPNDSIEYEIYIDDTLITTTIESELDCDNYTDLCTLSEEDHTWYVVAYVVTKDPNTLETLEREEIGRTQTQSFSIIQLQELSSEIVPVEIEEENPTTTEETNLKLLSDETLIATVPLAAISTVMLLTTLLSGNIQTISNYGVVGVLFGWVVRKRRKYTGIIKQKGTEQRIGLATIRVYRKEVEMNKSGFIEQSMSDLEGRYLIKKEEELKNEDYYIEVIAKGYKTQEIQVSQDRTKLPKVIELEREENINQRKIRVSIQHISLIIKVVDVVLTVVVIVGLIYTVYATIENPSILNYMLIVIYLVIVIGNVVNLLIRRQMREL